MIAPSFRWYTCQNLPIKVSESNQYGWLLYRVEYMSCSTLSVIELRNYRIDKLSVLPVVKKGAAFMIDAHPQNDPRKILTWCSSQHWQLWWANASCSFGERISQQMSDLKTCHLESHELPSATLGSGDGIAGSDERHGIGSCNDTSYDQEWPHCTSMTCCWFGGS